MDAIKHVAYNHPDPTVQHYFTELAKTKSGAVDMYSKKALLSPALIAGGGVAVAAGRKKDERPRDALKRSVRAPLTSFDALLDLLETVEFAAYDPGSDRSLRSGVRLDKYEKSIKNREIDRHIHDYIASAAIGAAASAAPARASIKRAAVK
jgi:hypothetical protein